MKSTERNYRFNFGYIEREINWRLENGADCIKGNMNSKSIFVLVYRLLGLASLAWGLYLLADTAYSIDDFLTQRINDGSPAYSLETAIRLTFPWLIKGAIFVFYGLFALHFSPRVLKWLYREE